MAIDQTEDVPKNPTSPDLLWDDEVRGLCVRTYGNGSKSFIFVYRFNDQQRFTRIGRSPKWSLKAARIRAKELQWIVDQGGDPDGEKHEPKDMRPIEELMQYIAEHPPSIFKDMT
jgi:Arm domain-containing DNA-binding protein